MQVRVPVVPTHCGALGVQTRVEQVPAPEQLCVSAHAVAAQLRPSGAQTSRPVSVPATQRAAPAVQMRV